MLVLRKPVVDSAVYILVFYFSLYLERVYMTSFQVDLIVHLVSHKSSFELPESRYFALSDKLFITSISCLL